MPKNPSLPSSLKTHLFIKVSIASQSLKVTKGEATLFEASISTASKGVGFMEGSYQTPTGRFQIIERIGEGAPDWTVFKGRVPRGLYQPNRDDLSEDAILTRILCLDGLDPNNSNSRARYIYLHGTQAEGLIGTPASCGCIRLKNSDIRDLFSITPLFTEVLIA